MNIDIKIGLTGTDTEVTHNGETINGISKLEIVVLPNEVTIAKLWISTFDCDDFAVNGDFYANDVNDGGKLKLVKNIEFHEENSNNERATEAKVTTPGDSLQRATDPEGHRGQTIISRRKRYTNND